MSSPTVREQPTAYNTFRLDGDVSPGISKIGGGKAQEEIQDQRQMLTTGANTVVQYSKNAVVTYTLVLWTVEDLKKWQKWEAMFLAGRSKRPVRQYSLVDLRMSWVNKVIFEAMAPQEVDKPGGPWLRELTLHQYNRVAPYGGPIKPGVLDEKIKDLEGQIAAERAKGALAQPVASIPPGKK